MSAVPIIPAHVMTLDQLDQWINQHAIDCDRLPNEWERRAARLRMMVAIIDRAGEIGSRQRAARRA